MCWTMEKLYILQARQPFSGRCRIRPTSLKLSMALRHVIMEFLEAERSYRRVQGGMETPALITIVLRCIVTGDGSMLKSA